MSSGRSRRFPSAFAVRFAAASNQGAAVLDTDTILLLNPDAVLETRVEQLAEACQEARVAAVAGKLVGGDGRPQAGFAVRRFPTPWTLAFEAMGWNRLWPGNPVNRHYRCGDLDLDRAADVEQPAGAFLLVRRDVWRELDGMDEQFHPLWFDDVDFLRRLTNRGYRVRYVPGVVARHQGGHSIEKLSRRCRILYWYDSLLGYTSKHFSQSGRLIVCAAVMIGSLARMPFAMVTEGSLRAGTIYARVIRMAIRFLFRGRRPGSGRFAALGTMS